MMRKAPAALLLILTANSWAWAISPPELNIGETWTYEIETEARSYKEKNTVIAIKDCGGVTCYLIHSESPGETNDYWMTRNWELFRNSGTSASGRYNFTYNPPLPIYAFPLEVGGAWSWNSTFEGTITSGGLDQNYTGTIAGIHRRVTAKEMVTVPAGTFEAYLVEHLDDKFVTRKLWFSEKVKEAVKFEFYERGRVSLKGNLVSFTLASLPGEKVIPVEMIGAAAAVGVAVVVIFIARARRKPTALEKGKRQESAA